MSAEKMRATLLEIAADCARLCASQSGTEWLRGEVAKMGEIADEAIKPEPVPDGIQRMRDMIAYGITVSHGDKRVDPVDFYARTVFVEPRDAASVLARKFPSVTDGVTSSPIASKSDAPRRSDKSKKVTPAEAAAELLRRRQTKPPKK